MKRRTFILGVTATLVTPLLTPRPLRAALEQGGFKKLVLSDEQWRRRLTPQQYHVLREAGTEPAHSSPLNKEKRDGIFACAGCELPLFTSAMKYHSGTGWPSFFDVIPGRVETKLDFSMLWPRTEYHCARCGGHQGHLFKDGPQPTGLRYCNNGLALKFIPGGNAG
jgi:peptide-methionine (R)-S-oxide reductase